MPPARRAVLSFQSDVAFGYVGNAVAAFVLRRAGIDCWPVSTVSFSHHPGYGNHRGRICPAAELSELIEGLARLGALVDCGAVLSGYLGSAENGLAVLDAAARVKAAQPDALYCCDPVMGDRAEGLYVPRSVVRFFRETALPAADILTPNHFELEVLVNRPLPDLVRVLAAAEGLRAQGPAIVLVSSLITEDQPDGTIATLVAGPGGAWRVATPLLPLTAKGTGDLLTALFLARLIDGAEPPDALAGAVAGTYAVIECTVAEPAARELRLIEAQAALVRPTRTFPAKRLR
jgi:pyridoxine kinase